MAWYPNAKRMEVQPEGDDQPAIRPTQFILHSIAAPWTPRRTYEYWRDSTYLESHFGIGYDGSIAQYIGTQTRADANYRANRRPDGTGAISAETASDDEATDPWTDRQLATIIQLGAWLHREHGIPLRICRTADDPGFGYHRMHAAWSDGGTDCPGDTRVAQFYDVVFPGIVKAAGGAPAPAPRYEPYPGEKWLKSYPTSPVITAMGERLVDEGCDAYSVGPGPEMTDADVESARLFQIKLGDAPEHCDGWLGPLQWAALKIPKV
ncbi:peptidoglycan-binding protein [Streptomyces syringium]|uniref:peptidoglycan-binding protein n=1 Tax=Streptomyces syringium TaxID=76729 RepID=UPI003655542A